MQCPDLHTIKAFLENDELVEARHSDHIRQCSLCQAQLEKLSEDPELRSWRDCLNSSVPTQPSDVCKQLVERLRFKDTRTDQSTAKHATPSTSADELAPRALESGAMIDHYCIVKEIGRGGMSIVVEAIDTRLNRPVALKLMLGPTLGHNARSRFVREVTTLSSIQHPNVISVYSAEYDGQNGPYLTMELIRGTNLREWIGRGTGFDFKQTAKLIAQVADGLSAAHRAGVLHRDIKPSNILIAEAGDEATSSTAAVVPKLADFGLALPMQVDNKLTLSGVLTGTPAYASPEQIIAPESITLQSDIYSLGVTLYEALTGTVPFHGSTQNVLKQIVEGEYIAPRRLNKEIPKDLETICTKAMSLSSSQRYLSAQTFAADLRHWLAGEPIVARPASTLEKGWRWAARNPRVAGLLALVGTLLVAIAGGSTYAAFTIKAAQKELKAESVKAQLASEQAEKSATIAMDQRELALDSLNQLINGVQTQLTGRAGTLKLREELLRTAAKGLTRIADGADASRVEQTTFDAHLQLAKIHFGLGETNEAQTHVKQVIDMSETALAARPEDTNLMRNLADGLSLQADIYRAEFANEKIESTLKRVLELREYVAAAKNDQDDTRRLNIVRQQLADFAWKRDELAVALSEFQQCATVARKLHEEQPEEKQLIRDLYLLHNRVATVFGQQNNLSESEKNFEIARGYCESLLKLDPDNQDYQTDSAYVLARIARMKLDSRELTAARELARQSLAQYEAIAAQDLDNVRAQSLAGSAQSLNCEVLLASGQLEEARKAAQANIAIQMRLAQKYPDTPKYVILATQSFYMASDIDLRNGNIEAALTELRTAIAALEKCQQSLDPSQVTTVTQVLEQCRAVADALLVSETLGELTNELLDAQLTINRYAVAQKLYTQARAHKLHQLDEFAPKLLALVKSAPAQQEYVEMVIARAYASASTSDPSNSSDRARQFKTRCIDLCRDMMSRRPQTRQTFVTDPDFDPLRADSDFQKLLAK